MDIEAIKAWFDKPREKHVDEPQVMELYFTHHPRTSFLKMLAPGASVADIGAGDGSLSVFRNWPSIPRTDLRMYAYSLEKGRMFDEFDGFEIGDWNQSPPQFEGRSFDAVVCAHFVEHIADPSSFVEWAARKLVRGGRMYVEWPAPASLGLPPKAQLEAAGVPLVISRFDDDRTHRALPDRKSLMDGLVAYGFTIEAEGIVRLPWLEDEMLAHFRDADDGFPRQAAFWSHTGWSQYFIACNDG